MRYLLGVMTLILGNLSYAIEEVNIKQVAEKASEKGIKTGLLYEVYTFMNQENFLQYIKGIVSIILLRLVGVVIIIYIGKRVIKIIEKFLVRLEENRKIDKSLGSFIISLYKVFSYILLIVISLRILGINETSLATILGAAGVGVGFAAKDILGNFAGGMIILVFKPYKIGDFIDVDGKSGEVKAISIFATELDTIDNKKIIVPNGKIITTHITNFTANNVRRVEIEFGIAYKSDFRKAIKILNEISENHDKIIQKIEKTIRVKSLGDSSVQILFRVWCKKDDYWDVHYDTVELAKEMFDREGIEIPFPQMDVHIKKETE